MFLAVPHAGLKPSVPYGRFFVRYGGPHIYVRVRYYIMNHDFIFLLLFKWEISRHREPAKIVILMALQHNADRG